MTFKSNPKVVVSIEARMNSSRLPGKVMEIISGQSVLDHLLDRLKRANRIDQVILATTTNSEDDILCEWAEKRGIYFFRGSENDVLSRVTSSHQAVNSDIVVEITGDCPLTDPLIVDWGVDTFLKNKCDVVTNCWHPGFPEGADVQVFKLDSLVWVNNNIFDSDVREHVSLYFYRNPEKYSIFHLCPLETHKYEGLRLQVDYPEDLQFIKRIFNHFGASNKEFGVYEIVQELKNNPDFIIDNKYCVEIDIRGNDA